MSGNKYLMDNDKPPYSQSTGSHNPGFEILGSRITPTLDPGLDHVSSTKV
jgi:hypothetical protein